MGSGGFSTRVLHARFGLQCIVRVCSAGAGLAGGVCSARAVTCQGWGVAGLVVGRIDVLVWGFLGHSLSGSWSQLGARCVLAGFCVMVDVSVLMLEI